MADQKKNLKFTSVTTYYTDTKKEDEKDRGIVGNKRGIDYHFSVAMLLCLEGYRKKLLNPKYDFIIHQEDETAGMFDDIIYEYTEDERKTWTRLLIQIKNKKKFDSSIKTSNLLYDDKKSTFNLIKFIKSSKDIKNTDNCFFIIYTNASFEFKNEDTSFLSSWYKKNTKEEISLLSSKVSCIPMFKCESQYKFDEEINVGIFCENTNISKHEWEEFLKKLVFVVGQPDLNEIKIAVEEKIEDILPKSTTQIWRGLYNILNESLYNHTVISSEQIAGLLENVEQEIKMGHDNKYESSRLEFKKNIPLYEFLISKNIVLPIMSINCEFTLNKICKALYKLRHEKHDVKKYTLKHVYRIIEVGDIPNATLYNLLIIILKNSDQLNNFKNTPKINGQKYVIIIPDEQNLPQMENFQAVYEDKENYFELLIDDSKKYVLEKKCIFFNGKKLSFSDVLNIKSSTLKDDQVKTLNNVITDDILKYYLEEDFTGLEISFNHSDLKKPKEYIDRELYSFAMIEEHKMKDFTELYVLDNFEEYKNLCTQKPDHNIHNFVKHDKYLMCTQSNGDLTYLRNFIDEDLLNNVTIQENELPNELIDMVLISDDPGMGKSTLLTSITSKLQSEFSSSIIIRLNLIDYTSSFNEKPDFNNHEDTKSFLKYKLLTNAKPLILSQNLCDFAFENGNKIFLLLDGFDEICPDYTEVVINFIKSLNKLKNIKLYITTRPGQTTVLEKHLSIIPISIKPFNEKNQRNYLERVMESHEDAERYLEKLNKNTELKQLLGVPLLLKIVIELLIDDKDLNIELYNLSEIFYKFVNQKFKIYSVEKKKQDETNPSVKRDNKKLQKRYQKEHEILALKLLFGERLTYETIDDDSKEEITIIGIITQIKDQRAEFIHRTFAEYFVSTYIQQHFNNDQIITLLLTYVLIQYDLKVLRKFINNYIKDQLNIEIKVKFNHCLNEHITNVDKQNPLSTLSRAAFDNNLETVIFILECFKDNKNILEQMLSYESATFGLSPVNNAIGNNNTEIAKELIKCCIENEISQNCGAFENLFNNMFTRGALYYATMADNTEIVSMLLHYGVDVNTIDERGNTVLHHASSNGNANIVNILLSKGANINLVGENETTTPLHNAVYQGHTNVVKVLLMNGANVNSTVKINATPLHSAVFKGNIDIVDILLDNGADINLVCDDGNTVLHEASDMGNVCLVNMLLKKGAVVNLLNNNYQTALHTAITKDHREVANILIDNGTDINVVNKYGRTVLHEVASKGNKDLISMLVDKGADINLSDKRGRTALFDSVYTGRKETTSILLNKGASVNVIDQNGDTILHVAAIKGNVELVGLLIDRGVSIEMVNNDGNTVLHEAVKKGLVDIVSLLLSKGIDLNKTNRCGDTVLLEAVKRDHTIIISLLLDNAIDVNKSDVYGNTPLHYTILCSRTRVLRELLKHGADINITNIFGERALHLAFRTGKYKLVKLFFRHDNDLYNYGDGDSDSDSDIDIDINKGLSTKLHRAIWCHDFRCAVYLLNTYYVVNSLDGHGRTPLYWAAVLGDCEIMRVLLEENAKVNSIDINGTTLLQAAFRSGNYRAVQVLFRNKSDVYYKCKSTNKCKGQKKRGKRAPVQKASENCSL